MLNIAIAARTDVGQRGHNEDDCKFGQFGPDGAYWYAVLSDGAGGHHGGAIASDLVVRMLAVLLQSADWHDPGVLSALVTDAHDGLRRKQQATPALANMQATVVVLWIDALRGLARWSHVGDSRLYLLRGGRVLHVTRDDSVVQHMVDAGFLSADDARRHPRKNQLLSAMGADEAVTPHTLSEPMTLRDGDALLLCSDGWWDPLEPGGIEAALAAATSVDDWLDRMAAAVHAQALPRQDNYTAVGVWVGDASQATVIVGG